MDSTHVSAAPFSAKNIDLETVRRSVTYHSTIWGEHFLVYGMKSSTSEDQEEIVKQREEVRRMFAEDSLIHKLDLIDAVQRLGVGYHFEKEIDESLHHLYEGSCLKWNDSNLRTVALRFRLLRQHGYRVSCDVFKQFKDADGKFDKSLTVDLRGLLSLYEAANLGTHGEEILEEALEFCTKNLESIILHTYYNSPLATQIKEALNSPIHKSFIISEAKKFVSTYQNEESHDKTLLNFAKRNFNVLQKMYQKELSDITKWWKDLDFKNKFPFARDRMVECYFWALGVYYEPQYMLARKIMTKVLVMATVIDDIYDVQGTLDELQIFTHAIQKWDTSAMKQLPPYMRICYQLMLDIYDEMELELGKTTLLYRVNYAKEEMKKLTRAYFEEAKWLFNNHIPTLDEYMKVGVVSAGYMMLTTTSLVGMGDVVAKEDFKWISSEPLLVRASAIIGR